MLYALGMKKEAFSCRKYLINITLAFQMLPHPSFVYCALFVPGNSLSLATGCCDKVIRLWRKSNDILHFEVCWYTNEISKLH